MGANDSTGTSKLDHDTFRRDGRPDTDAVVQARESCGEYRKRYRDPFLLFLDHYSTSGAPALVALTRAATAPVSSPGRQEPDASSVAPT